MTYRDNRYDLKSLMLLADDASAPGDDVTYKGLDQWYIRGALIHPSGTDGLDVSHLDGFERGLPVFPENSLKLNTHGMTLDELADTLWMHGDVFGDLKPSSTDAPKEAVCVAADGTGAGCLAYAVAGDGMTSGGEDELAYMVKGAFVA